MRTKPALRHTLWALLTLGALTLSWLWFVYQNTSPWFGRGLTLTPYPRTIVLGPVDAVKGMAGLLEVGMPRQVVVSHLGPPLVSGLSSDEARRRGFFDPEDVSADFFGGVFSWVDYNSDQRVSSITFDLAAYSQKFHGEQNVFLMCGRHGYMLKRDLSSNQVIDLLKTQQDGPRFRVQGEYQIVLIDTGTALEFDNQKHLSSVHIGFKG